ncbi:hypothetical protein AAF712_014287 [Marasmius tenuissimus]|uniref:Uncharacterized protein n=1 Tax=Marasmius tenuissimus TaxID=585030 RepID=A0ABR2ZBN6_9AGAR
MPSRELDDDDRKFIEQVPSGILMEYRDKCKGTRPPENSQQRVKVEDIDTSINLDSSNTSFKNGMRVLVQEGREIYEILDSDEEETAEAGYAGAERASSRCSEYSRVSSPTVVGDVSNGGEHLGRGLISGESDVDSSGLDSDIEFQAGLGHVTSSRGKQAAENKLWHK